MFCEEYNILRHKKTGVALLAEPGRCGGFLPSAGTSMRHREHHPDFFNKNKKIYLLIFHVVCPFELNMPVIERANPQPFSTVVPGEGLPKVES